MEVTLHNSLASFLAWSCGSLIIHALVSCYGDLYSVVQLGQFWRCILQGALVDLNRSPQGTAASNPVHLHASSTQAKYCSLETYSHYLENYQAKGYTSLLHNTAVYTLAANTRHYFEPITSLIEVTCNHTPSTTRWQWNERCANYSASLFTEATDLLSSEQSYSLSVSNFETTLV